MVTEATEAPDDGASEEDDPEPTISRVACICPPKADGEPRHPDGDVIELRERLDFTAGRTAKNILMDGIRADNDAAEVRARLTEWYILNGIRTWTVVDAKGKAVEPNRHTIREYLLNRADSVPADIIGDAVDVLYTDAVVDPLVARGFLSLPSSPTEPSTSATNGSSRKPRKPSKRSSISTIPMADTGTTSSSHDGDSKSSQNSDMAS